MQFPKIHLHGNFNERKKKRGKMRHNAQVTLTFSARSAPIAAEIKGRRKPTTMDMIPKHGFRVVKSKTYCSLELP